MTSMDSYTPMRSKIFKLSCCFFHEYWTKNFQNFLYQVMHQGQDKTIKKKNSFFYFSYPLNSGSVNHPVKPHLPGIFSFGVGEGGGDSMDGNSLRLGCVVGLDFYFTCAEETTLSMMTSTCTPRNMWCTLSSSLSLSLSLCGSISCTCSVFLWLYPFALFNYAPFGKSLPPPRVMLCPIKWRRGGGKGKDKGISSLENQLT